ncbi:MULTISPECIES: LytTR family DNA-binding domain-containing protein [unclassified Phenylobacterium]|uniref:LytR/AlgR family response regulator transcription factor n=1 Tax=unclassified Phenylobacterium TaxID=2640670 RepID=UPI00083A95A4|nr:MULTISPECIES: LytTR family DNA-binding domain-containing protein [unclassified Phenylobacterium]
MRKLRALAVDDEALALMRLEALLRRIAGVELVAVARTASEALARLAEGGIDVVLLDIRLTGSDGFEVAAALRAPAAPQVIFVTSFDEYAVRAFDVAATDFLMKPVEAARLSVALERAREVVRSRAAIAQQSQGAVQDRAIWLALRDGAVQVRLSEILYVEAEGDYVRVHTEGTAHFLRRTIGGLAAELDPTRFLRISRSAIVQIARLKAVARRGRRGVWVALDDGRELKVGRTYEGDVWRRLA